MARVPIVTRDMVPEENREAFDELTKDTGGTITGGPISIIVNSPELARRRAGLTSYLRYESTFSNRIRELAILVTARNFDCPYVWNAHAPDARKARVSDGGGRQSASASLCRMADDEPPSSNYATSSTRTTGVSSFNLPV